MKFLKKINIGLILAIITIIAVVIYSINIEIERNNSKEDIRKVCEEFINLTNKYAVLPEEYQVIGQDTKTVNLNDFSSKMEEDLKNIMVTDSAVAIQKSILADVTQNDLLNTANIICSFDRKISKISSYEFDGNQVTVTFISKITIKQKYNDINMETGEQKEKIKEHIVEKNQDTITLDKKDGVWKVVYADLDYSINDLSEIDSTYNGL